MISTQAGILLGHVFDGMMINLKPENAKLRNRAAGIVQTVADVPAAEAESALQTAQFDTKLAILIAAGHSPGAARGALTRAGGRLQACLPDRSTETIPTSS